MFKPAKDSSVDQHLRIPQPHGTVVAFSGEALTDWRHGVPKEAESARLQTFKDVAPRISLSFRSYATT